MPRNFFVVRTASIRMDNEQLVKIALVALAAVLLYKYIQSQQRGGHGGRWKHHGCTGPPRVSHFVPFKDMPFEEVPASPAAAAAAAQKPPLVMPTNVASDLLPTPPPAPNKELDFGEFAPQPAALTQNFLTATQAQGIDTKGSSLRNANLQLRSEPPNPRRAVGPWLTSTIDPDLMRRPLE